MAIHVSQLQRPVEVEAVLSHYAEDMSPATIKKVGDDIIMELDLCYVTLFCVFSARIGV